MYLSAFEVLLKARERWRVNALERGLLPNRSFSLLGEFLVRSELLKTGQAVENVQTVVEKTMPVERQIVLLIACEEFRFTYVPYVFVGMRVVIVLELDVVRPGVNEVHEEILLTIRADVQRGEMVG